MGQQTVTVITALMRLKQDAKEVLKKYGLNEDLKAFVEAVHETYGEQRVELEGAKEDAPDVIKLDVDVDTTLGGDLLKEYERLCWAAGLEPFPKAA